jgi:hypothetical protein
VRIITCKNCTYNHVCIELGNAKLKEEFKDSNDVENKCPKFDESLFSLNIGM